MPESVLIDSSCWIEFFRGAQPELTRLIQKLLSDDRVVICGPVYVEVLGSCKHRKESQTVARYYDEFPFLDLTREDFREASYLRQQLRKKGETVATVDLLIAYLAIKNKCTLLHQDSDFDRIAKYSSLKTLRIT
ncbi:MAG: PIN domain nuclease [Deltaproteobacteria bacterium]|nr:PIN domain nuclease [Deltaproteobacteria bacterium]